MDIEELRRQASQLGIDFGLSTRKPVLIRAIQRRQGGAALFWQRPTLCLPEFPLPLARRLPEADRRMEAMSHFCCPKKYCISL